MLYVLPYGQMSLWGIICLTCNAIFSTIILTSILCLQTLFINEGFLFINVYLGVNSRRQGLLAKRLPAVARVGPHNHNILSIFSGTLLGDAHAELRSSGNGTRISISQESNRAEYLLYLHKLIADLGYCNPNTPVIQSRLGANGTTRYIMRFHTYTYSSLNSLHSIWYNSNGIKHVPETIADFLTPLALAIWIMDDGGRVGYGLKLATNSFTFADSLRLVRVLHDLYGLKASVQSAGVRDQYHIYIWSESMPILRELVRPHMVPPMLYKLGE